MAWGEGAWGETAWGEGVGAVTVGAVDGIMLAIEAPDAATITGFTTAFSISAVADDNLLVIMIELDLGQF